jgi:hypothetical protein
MATPNIPRLDRNMFYKLVKDDMLNNNLPNHVMWVNEIFDPMDRVTREE